MTLLEVMLHISPDEQRERLLARFDNAHEHGKVDPADVDERAHWHAHQTSYEVALERCSTPAAPWHVVPADRKWYRNWALSNLLLASLEGLDLHWPRPQLDLDGMRAALHAP